MTDPEAFPTPPPPAPAPALLPILTVGFGTAAAMWMLGFLTHLPGLRTPPMAVGVLLIAAQVAGGFFAARLAPERAPWLVGLGAGLVTSLLNLLIVGSVVAPEPGERGLAAGWGMVVGGSIALGAAAGVAGALLGALSGRGPRNGAGAQRWLCRFGIVTALAALPVLLSGGLVTSHGAGLAVPDWPTSFGANMFLFPLAKMTGGIYYEHAHRLFGTLVGAATIALLILVLVYERRGWVKACAVAALLAVIAQGVLGGVGVTGADPIPADASTGADVAAAPADEVPANFATRTDNPASKAMRMVHGVTGQLTFAWLCVVAAFLSPRWLSGDGVGSIRDPFLRKTAMIALPVLVLQIILGAGTRHFDLHPAFMHMHIWIGAVAATVFIAMAGYRAGYRQKQDFVMRKLGHACAHTVGVQVVLGIAAFAAVMIARGEDTDVRPAYEVVLATAHQAVGAFLLAFVTLLFAWTRRLVAKT